MTTPRDPIPAHALRVLTTDPGPWLSCDDCFRLADQFVERLVVGGSLGEPEMVALRAHLAGCPACSEETTSLLLLAAEDAGVDPTAALGRLET